MKALVQKVKFAKCVVDGKVVSEIKEGLLVFLGVSVNDTIDKVDYIAKKVANIRIFPNEFGKVDKSVLDLNYEILNISQFTLYGDVKKGNRPSFTDSMNPIDAEILYHAVTKKLINEYKVNTYEGIFGADMKIELLNDGPMTILIEN